MLLYCILRYSDVIPVIPVIPLFVCTRQCRRSFHRIFGQRANSPPVDYRIWSVVQQRVRVYQSRVHDTDELKQRLQ